MKDLPCGSVILSLWKRAFARQRCGRTPILVEKSVETATGWEHHTSNLYNQEALHDAAATNDQNPSMSSSDERVGHMQSGKNAQKTKARNETSRLQSLFKLSSISL